MDCFFVCFLLGNHECVFLFRLSVWWCSTIRQLALGSLFVLWGDSNGGFFRLSAVWESRVLRSFPSSFVLFFSVTVLFDLQCASARALCSFSLPSIFLGAVLVGVYNKWEAFKSRKKCRRKRALTYYHLTRLAVLPFAYS